MQRPRAVLHGNALLGRSIMPDRRYFGKDALAGLPGAISSVPDGTASAVLVGVNPVHGLYASFAGPVAVA
jgi:sulfate permease, SulP family